MIIIILSVVMVVKVRPISIKVPLVFKPRRIILVFTRMKWDVQQKVPFFKILYKLFQRWNLMISNRRGLSFFCVK